MACAGCVVSSKVTAGVKERLESLVDNVKIAREQIATKSSTRKYDNNNFSTQQYWSDLVSRVAMVSDWCTKLTVFFSKPPTPKLEECGAVIDGIENAIITMTSSYYTLPPSQGATLGRELQEAILDILAGVESLAVTIIRHGSDCQFEKLKETGSVWSSCDKISRLSKDNRAAVLRVFITNLQLLQDACNEAEQIITNDDCCMDELEEAVSVTGLTGNDKDHVISDDDKILLQHAIGLIKTCPKCVANISRAITKYGNTVTCDGIEQLDAAAAVVTTISPCIDDLVSTLYPPIAIAAVTQSAAQLKDKLLNLLEKCSKLNFCKMAEFLKLDDVKEDILKTYEGLISKYII